MEPRCGRQAWARALVASAGLAGLLALAPVGSASATASFASTRIAGENRYDTAAKLALGSFGKSGGAILATGEAFPDALAASFIAGYVNSPILLVERTHVPDATQAALTQLGVKELVLLGGTAAISDEVQKQLEAQYSVVRLYGADRFATAANIALAVNPADIGELDGARTAFLSYGYNFADALAVGPLAFAGRFPILLNGSTGLGTPAKVALDRLKIAHVVIVGGVIDDTARAAIEAMGITTERVQGPDRFATAAAVATFALTRLDFVADHVDLALGIDRADPRLGFADALAGSVHAGREHAPLLLTDPSELSGATETWLEAHADKLATGDVLGGETAVSPAVEQQAVASARSMAGAVVDVDLSTHRYTYRPDGGTETVIVAYVPTDTFRVDGQAASIEAFEAALSVGDRVRVAPTPSGASHHLANAS